LIALVRVPASGIGLPDLDQRMRDRPLIFVKDAARHDNPLSDRWPGMVNRQVVIMRGHSGVAIDGRAQLGERLRNDDERLMWVT
jgi:hypothetical protein